MNYDGTKCFFHVDLDAFFASVEQLVHPEWKGKPVVVGGVPGDRRAVVSTASYEARKFGVHSAMPLARAVELCPDAIYVRGNHKLYSEYSEKIMEIFGNYSPDVKQISIDEAFLDLTGTGRLFGDPIETARRLKAEVFEKTGLTVSVGIATSNYIAKISSGLQKPDGLYAVLPGEEENFMLNLPLEKVWGIGRKTLARLKEAGFYSTQDIHNHSQKLLASIFGEAQAEFLYSVVRGIDPPGFLEKAKSHSAGIETTYDHDLTEWDAIEAALLALSEQLMFRLLKNNITGKTLVIKIRYEDFTTVSVRETSGQNITSVDDLFSRAKKIFRKKYEAGRGIRLLGITVGNTQDADSERQNELFDFGEGKKRAIEKSILKLEQKNPEIKIHKARLLSKTNNSSRTRSIAALFAIAALLFFQKPVFADKTTTLDASGSGSMVVGKDLPPEANPQGATLFDVTIHDKHLKFDAFGWWNAKVTQTTTMTFGFGNDFEVDVDVPIFKQEIDLSLSFLLNDHWFFEAAFADEFETNTIAMGYTNGEKYVREVRISNRYITFPSTYSVDDVGRGIGGGKNQAPGISANFADPDGTWTLDTAVRYDMLTQRDKTYYGKNSVDDTDRSKSSFITGRMYVLPSYESTTNVTGVYVESYGGNYTDAAGKKYKKLSTSDYIVIPSRKMIMLSSDAGAEKKNSVLPAVAVTFQAGGIAQLKSELGTYGTATSPGTGFLGEVQSEFGSDLKSGVPIVASFSYGKKSGNISVPDSSGTATEGFFGTISGEEVLYIQHPAGFSPFTVAFRYDLGTSKIDEISVVNKQSGKAVPQYAAVQAEDDLSITDENFFTTEHFYADAYNTQISSNDYANPVIRFPFCRTSPGTYLGYGDNDETVLRARNYTPVNRFDIGTDAVAGTVMVYKNAVLDSGAKYDAESGEVTLSTAVSATDKIYIVWSEDSKSFDSGAIAGAAGFNYNITENLSADVSAATRWTIAPNMTYADSAQAAMGYATLASRIKYENENLTLSNTIAGTAQNANTKGIYKVFGFDDAQSTTYYNGSKAGKSLPEDFAPLLLPRPSDTTSKTVELFEEKNRTSNVQEGYSDKAITGYKIPISFNFTGDAEEWAAQTIAITGSELPSSSKFTVALKTDSALQNVDVYLQLGVNPDENFSYENKGSIATWKIASSGGEALVDVTTPFNPASTDWQHVSVTLTDVDRAHCTNYTAARLIIVNAAATDQNGTIYFGPYEICPQGIFTQQDQAFTIMTSQTRSQNSMASDLNKSTNYAQEISWSSIETNAPSDTQITMYKYFEEADISDYSEINMLFKYNFDVSPIENDNDQAALIFLLDTESTEVTGEGKVAARAEISKNALKNYGDNKWHRLTIQTDKSRAKIDGDPLPASECSVQVNRKNIPSRAKIVFNTSGADGWHKSGSFCIDEIYFSETSMHFILEDKNFVEYKTSETLVTVNDYELLKNIQVHAGSRESLALYTQENRDNKGDISADAGLKFTFADINFSADIARAAEANEIISNAGHAISTDTPILQTIDFSEEYNFDAENNSAVKINSAKLDFNSLNVPLAFSGSTKSDSSEWSITTESQTAIDSAIKGEKLKYNLHIGTLVSQKILPAANGIKTTASSNYFEAWFDSTKYEFSGGDSLASKRKVGAEIKNTFNLPWAALAPQINFTSEENYSAAKNVYYSDKSAFEFVLPFKLKRNSFSLSWKKTSGGANATTQGGDYYEDIYNLCDALGERGYFFATPIFYDLFSEDLQDKVQNNIGGVESESEYYTGEYAFNFSRPVFSDKFDIIVPSSAALTFARDIRAAETLSDTYQAKLRLGWTALNIFGSEGVIPIAKWFEQDEYITSFIVTLKFPHDEPSDIKQVYTTYIQANFYITENNIWKNGLQFEFQDKNNLSAKFTTLWRRPGKFSPVLAFIKLFAQKLDITKINFIRNNSLNCEWKKSLSGETEKKFQSYEFSHSVDYQASKYIWITTGMDLGWSCMWDDICTLTMTWTLGGKLLF